MYPILKLVLLAAAANCAPTTLIPIAAPQPYFFYTPQLQNQFQYQQLVKIQQPAAPAAITRIDKPKEQYVLLYPSIPQLPLVALRDDEGQPDFWGGITNWFNEFQNNFNQMPTTAPAEESGSTDSKLMEKNPELTQPSLPASTTPLNTNKRLYLISSQPQFYGNYAALQPARITTPILAIEPLRARSTADPVAAENEKVEQPLLQEVVESAQQPAVLQPLQQLQLRSNFVEPLQRLEVNQPQIPVVNNEPAPGVAALQLARFLEEARSQDTTIKTGNRVNENDANKIRNEAKPSEDEEEPSIAQAKPSGIALSGKGGVSSSAPSATAVVGDGGLALASPSAISLSGDFQEEEQEGRKKQAEPFGST